LDRSGLFDFAVPAAPVVDRRGGLLGGAQARFLVGSLVQGTPPLPDRVLRKGEETRMSLLRDLCREGVYRMLYAYTGQGLGLRAALLYHSVGGKGVHSVGAEAFERQMELLAMRFSVVRLRDLAKAMTTTPPDANLVCVTFDDGYRDNYEVAVPVLERFGIKATFFIATGFLGGTFRTRTGEGPMMTADQIRKLAAAGHEIGAHTVTHPKLTKMPEATVREEIERAKGDLENLLGSPISSFAYPNGAYDRGVRELVRLASFRQAATVREGLIDGESDWLALPRVWVSGKLSLKGFEARLSPATTWYRRLRQSKELNPAY